MNKKLTFVMLLLLCLAMLGLSVWGATNGTLLSDGADLLADHQEQELLTTLNRIRADYQVDVIVVTVDSIGSYSPESYVNYLFDSQGYGYGANQDGVLLLVAMESRDYQILANGLGADAISDSDLDSLCGVVESYLRDGDYMGAFCAFAEECEYEINGAINGFPFDWGKNLLIALVVGLAIALIVVLVMLSQLKSVKPKRGAAEYTKADGMRITRSSDLFLYRTVSRIRRETDSSGSHGGGGYRGGSSGGGRRVGGGKF